MNDIKPKLINLVAALSVTQSISKTIAEALFVLIDKWNIGEYLSTLELTTKLLHAITPTSSETSISERPDAGPYNYIYHNRIPLEGKPSEISMPSVIDYILSLMEHNQDVQSLYEILDQ